MNIQKLETEDIRDLIRTMVRSVYKAKDSSSSVSLIMQACLDLFEKDYKISVVNNMNGELCNSYPSKIVLLEYEKSGTERDELVESIHDVPRLTKLFTKARFARCWTRFVVPVILYEGRHICRSATISSGTEIYGRSSFDFFFTGGESIPPEESGRRQQSVINRQLCDRIRGQDIKLLDELNVRSVCDLMMETKKVKYFVNVTSSEKVDKEQRYSKFSLWSTPYPGCEFFRQWHDTSYSGERSFFNWEQEYVNTTLELPTGEGWFEDLHLSWANYKAWNIVRLTRSYMRLILKFVQDGKAGLLIHCISGWDRTPLFISLLRLSLWADGLVHRSLSAEQVLFLTIAYDWYMFGHNLPDRLLKGEEIFFFCFYFLKFMQDEEFVVAQRNHRSMSVNGLADHKDVLSSPWMEDCSMLSDMAQSEWQKDGLMTLEEELFTAGNGCYESCSQDQFCVDDRRSTPELSTNQQRPAAHQSNGTGGRRTSCSESAACGAASPPVDRQHTSAARLRGSSTPVAVPSSASLTGSRRLSSQSFTDLDAVGSWQLLNNCDFYCGSSSSHSPQPADSSAGGMHRRGLSRVRPSSEPAFAGVSHTEPSERRRRLEEVRARFYDAYSTVVGIGTPPGVMAATGGGSSRQDFAPQQQPGGGGGLGISSVLGYIAGKVSSRK